MKKIILLTILIMAAFYCPILAQSTADKADFHTSEVEIKGWVENPMTLTV